MMIKHLIFLLAFVWGFAFWGFAFCQSSTDRNLNDEAPTGFQSMYTPLELGDCFLLNASNWYGTGDIGPGFFSQECPALRGYKVIVHAGDLRSWLVLERADEEFVFRSNVWEALGGAFPYISGSLLEWRFLWSDDLSTQLVALIYRMTRQNPETFEDTSALVVLRMTGASPCLLGIAASNVEARALADDLTQTCATE